jgi:fluoride exporter
MMKYFMVGIGGFLGTIARFWLGGFIHQKLGTRFPYGTFVINCSGCFAIGLIMTILSERTHLNPYWRLLIPIGFIGAYTTFSTFEYESLMAMRDGALAIAFLNIVASVIVGFVCVWAGVVCGRAVA